MSDEPKSKDSGEWRMPEPVFRSSEGRRPRASKKTDADEVDTLAPDSDDVDQDDIETEVPNIREDDIDTLSLDADEIAPTGPADGSDSDANPDDISDKEPSTTVRAAPEKAEMPKGGCAKNIMMFIGVIAFVALAVVIALVYFLFYYRPAETGTF
jgi:hypothetical protein